MIKQNQKVRKSSKGQIDTKLQQDFPINALNQTVTEKAQLWLETSTKNNLNTFVFLYW